MAYEVTSWKNTVHDNEGNELQKGTPYSAENMNKIEQQLLVLDEVQHDHANKDALNNVTQEQLDKIHDHDNMPVLEQVTQAVVDDTHKHPNKSVLDKVTQKNLDDIVAHGVILSDHEQRLVNIVESVTNLKIKAVQTIAERDALVNKESIIVHVVDATVDATVVKGWAQYIYQSDAWVKIAENESIDVVLSWASLIGKPTTFPATAHEHPKSQVTGLQAELDAKFNRTGDTITGPLKIKDTAISTDEITFDGATAVGMRVTNPHGYVSIAPLNTSGAHIYTDRALFFFNKTPVSINNMFSSYNHDLQLQRQYVTKLTLGVAMATFLDSVKAPFFVQTDGKMVETTTGAQARVDTHSNDGVKHVTPAERTKINDAFNASHAHANKVALDLVTQAMINNSHTHENSLVLAGITQALLNKIHSHENQAALNKIAYSGTETAIDLIQLEELAVHTHEYSALLNKPVIPTQTSQLTNNSEFLASNAARMTVSTTAPVNPKVNDIWIVI